VRDFSGHTDMVTAIDLAQFPVRNGVGEELREGVEAGESLATSTEHTDAIASVSDDGTVRVFVYSASALLA